MDTAHDMTDVCDQRFRNIESDIDELKTGLQTVCSDVSKIKTESAVTSTIVARIEKVMWWVLTGVIGSLLVTIIANVLK